MFNLSGSEIIAILLIALVVLGPDKLPDAMRRAGRTFAELKKLSSGFQDEVRKGFDEPVKEVKQTAASVRSAASFKVDDKAGKAAKVDDKAAKVDEKPRYNPAVDPPPTLPAGSSVAEPSVGVPVAVPEPEADAGAKVQAAPGSSTVADVADVTDQPEPDIAAETVEPPVSENADDETAGHADRAR